VKLTIHGIMHIVRCLVVIAYLLNFSSKDITWHISENCDMFEKWISTERSAFANAFIIQAPPLNNCTSGSKDFKGNCREIFV
jgi:hypothetical protein